MLLNIETLMKQSEEVIVKNLLSAFEQGISPDAWNEHRQTPLMIAASRGRLNIVTFLLDNNASLTLKDADGNTALHYAMMGKNPDASTAPFEIAKQLLMREPSLLEIKNNNDETPLMWAASEGQYTTVRYFLEQSPNFSARDRNNRNVLCWAADGPREESNDEQQAQIISLLIEYNATIDSDDDDEEEESPLILATCKGYTQCVEVLLNHRANINKVYQGETALSEAAIRGDKKMVQLLLKYGADSRRENSSSLTPFDLTNSLEVKRILEEHSKRNYEQKIKLFPVAKEIKKPPKKLCCTIL